MMRFKGSKLILIRNAIYKMFNKIAQYYFLNHSTIFVGKNDVKIV